MKKRSSVPVEVFYKQREEYSILGLTGVAGSGCSTFAELISNKEKLFNSARKPEDIFVNYPVERNSEKQLAIKELDVNSSIRSFVRRKKYEICYHYLQENYQEYKVIKYTHLLWLYLLLIAKHYNYCDSSEQLASMVWFVLVDKFKPSVKHDVQLKEAIGYSDERRAKEISDIINGFSGWNELARKVKELSIDWVERKFEASEKREYKRILAEFFLSDSSFLEFVKYFITKLAKLDYYSSCFYHHRFATQVRSTGNPFEPYDDWFESSIKGCDNLYVIIRLFVLLIDGIREGGGNRRIVIDSIRNSSEALYLKERYSGFYLIAIHDENSLDHLKEKVKNQYKSSGYSEKEVDLFYRSYQKLTQVESDQDDFENGIFSSPDIERVIERSEIHINNIWDDYDDKEAPSSRYMAEQWIKYAALILHPGLVTPTTSERCMAVAFTAKLNSGCLSRQVGAAITNKDGSVRSIGWNEVPHGQVSCSLRTIDGIVNSDECALCSYSEFEMMGTQKYKDGKTFIEKLKDDFGNDLSSIPVKLHGLPFSYCFKALHNRYEGEKNQVFTRSLHAEENAIIQMSKYGGEALKEGIIYVTASPCELCSKKLYQIGVRQIVYIDPYPGIARKHIISAGFKQPDLKIFEGAIGSTYFKLYQPFIPYKDELSILTKGKHNLNPSKTLLEKLLKELDVEEQQTYTNEEIDAIVGKVKMMKNSISCDNDATVHGNERDAD